MLMYNQMYVILFIDSSSSLFCNGARNTYKGHIYLNLSYLEFHIARAIA